LSCRLASKGAHTILRILAPLRVAVERLSRGVVLRRRLPADLGGARIYVSPDSGLKLWHRSLGSIGTDLHDIVRRFVQPGMVVWDVGANLGLFAFAAAARAGPSGQVVAVEADAWLACLLRRSAAALPFGHARVDVVCAAAADRPGLLGFVIAARGRGSNALEGYGESQMGGIREAQTAAALPLEILLEHFGRSPEVLKIDVEGAEVLVLRGAAGVLSGPRRPVLVIEVAARNAEEVTALLLSLGYTFHDMDDGCRPVRRVAFNTLALPRGGSRGSY
jgi:FkbM family methyltransferase